MARNNGKSNGKAVDLGKQLVQVQKALVSKRSALGANIARGQDVEFLADEINTLERTEAAIQAGLKALVALEKSNAAKSKVKQVEDVRLAAIRGQLEAGRLEAYRLSMILLERVDENIKLETALGFTSQGRVPGFMGDMVRLLKNDVKRIYDNTPEDLGGRHYPSPDELKRMELQAQKKQSEKMISVFKSFHVTRNSEEGRRLELAENALERTKKQLSALD